MPQMPSLPAIIAQKLALFEERRDDFMASFAFREALHGQERFAHLSVADAVRYLHACFICDCKDRLLSVTRTIPRYGGEEALRLLATWWTGDTAPVIAFLHDALDSQPFGSITRQWQDALATPGDEAMAERLAHGRLVMLNRTLNMAHLFEAIFSLPQGALISAVQGACAALGYDPETIARALAALATEPYQYARHRALEECNMSVMNALGVATLTAPADLPGDRTWRVSPGAAPDAPFAEIPIPAYTELTAPLHNNPRHVPFTDRPDTPLDEARSHEIVVDDLHPQEGNDS